jgi:hypothetical protein
MGKRAKRLRKQEQGLLRQAKIHIRKVKTELGRKDTTRDYWLKEIEKFRRQAEKKSKLRRKLGKKRHKSFYFF